MSYDCECLLAGNQEVAYRNYELPIDIAFVGESPGKEELVEGKSFVGRAGRLLNDEVKRAGLQDPRICFFNAARCLMDKDVLSDKDMRSIVSSCKRRFLDAAISQKAPRLIVCLGDWGLFAITGKKGVGKERGSFVWSEAWNCWVFTTWHPAYILRRAGKLPELQRDLEAVAEFANNGFEPVPQRPASFEWGEVDSIRPFLGDPSFKAAAIDTETQGLFWYNPNFLCLSASISINLHHAVQLTLFREIPSPEGASFSIWLPRAGTKKKPKYVEVFIARDPLFDQKVAELKELMGREDIKKYLMNIKFDLHALETVGVSEFRNCPMDIQLAAHVLDSDMFLEASLETLESSFLRIPVGHKDLASSEDKLDMLKAYSLDRNRIVQYACGDVIATHRTALSVKEALKGDELAARYYLKFAHPITTKVLMEIERKGIRIDEEALPSVRDQVASSMNQKASEFMQKTPLAVREKYPGDQFKLTKKKLLSDVFFVYTDPTTKDHIDIGLHQEPPSLSPKTRLPAFDKTARLALSDATSSSRVLSLLDLYKDWSEHNTLVTRYFSNIQDHLAPDGRIHPSYGVTNTSSGRTGARSPSIQNFPKRGPLSSMIRRLLVASPGNKLLAIDQSLSELRWAAHVANEPTMKEILLAGGDIHLNTARAIYALEGKHDFSALSKEEVKDARQKAKAVNFGFVYMMSAHGFRSYARTDYGLRFSYKQAEMYREEYFKLYYGLPSWHEECYHTITETGGIRSIFGRPRRLPGAQSPEYSESMRAVRIGVNYVIQGPSSDCVLYRALNILEDPEYNPEAAKIRAFIHDELIFEVPESSLYFYGRMFKKHMENTDFSEFGFKLSVPLVAELSAGDNLAEMTPLEV